MDKDSKLKKKEKKEKKTEFIEWVDIDFIYVAIELSVGPCIDFLFYCYIGLKFLQVLLKLY